MNENNLLTKKNVENAFNLLSTSEDKSYIATA